MKINEVTEAGMETTPEQKKLADIGRALMAHSESVSMKGKTEDEIALFNKMSELGRQLTEFGTSYGPRNQKDLMKKTGLSLAMIGKFMEFGEKLVAKGVAPKVADPEPEDEPEDDFGEPDDDAMARKADMMAKRK